MTKLPVKVPEYKKIQASITVYLSLIILLIISFIVGILDAAWLQNSKAQTRSGMIFGTELAFAEYQADLLREYNLFAIDGTYESGNYEEENVLERILYYGGSDTQMELSKIQLLTDGNNADFLRQTYEYVKTKKGLSWLEEKKKEQTSYEESKFDAQSSAKEYAENEVEIEELLEAEEQSFAEENPISHISKLKSLSLLDLVISKEEVSNQTLDGSNLYKERTPKIGRGTIMQSGANETLLKLAFVEYAFDHFSYYGDEKEGGILAYELEYLLGGEKEDRENLKKVMNKLLFLRFGANYLFLQTNSEKKAEANALATSLCLLFQSPFATSVVTQGILLAWAYGESIMDLRALFTNKKVPMVKNTTTWQLSLSSLLTLGTSDDQESGKDSDGGLAYRDYLKILLQIEGVNETTNHAITLIEKNMHKQGQEFILMDQLIVGIEVQCLSRLRGNIKYEYQVGYSYNH